MLPFAHDNTPADAVGPIITEGMSRTGNFLLPADDVSSPFYPRAYESHNRRSPSLVPCAFCALSPSPCLSHSPSPVFSLPSPVPSPCLSPLSFHTRSPWRRSVGRRGRAGTDPPIPHPDRLGIVDTDLVGGGVGVFDPLVDPSLAPDNG